MADTRSPEEIERDIERERAELSSTLETLTDKFSVDRVVKTSQDYVTEHGGEIAANFARTIKDTPTAAVLTAVGIGWMILGNQRQRVVEYRGRSDYDADPYAGGDYGRDSYDRPEYRATSASAYDATGYGSSASSGSSSQGYGSSSSGSNYGAAMGSEGGDFDDRVAAADARMRASATGTAGIMDDDVERYSTYDAERDLVSRDYGEGRSEDETSMLERISDHAQDIWHQTVDAVRSGYRSAYRSATELRNSLFEGTEKMDVRGRERVATARARAYQAQLRGKDYARDYARQGQQRANDFFYEQPLVAGALAVALGAVVGGLLPRTRREDEAFGAYRDQLFDDAEAVFRDERMRVEAAARAALAEAGDIAEEAKDSVLGRTPDGREAVDAAEDKARTAAQRVASAAREAHDSGSAAGSTSSTSGGTTAGTV